MFRLRKPSCNRQAMSLVRVFTLTLFTLSGCAGPQAAFGPAGWSWPFAQAQGDAAGTSAALSDAASYAQFSFDWQLSGEPEVMPVQVFDDGLSMWLQFSPEGAWPAVFKVSAAGWRPLSYRSEPPYMVLDGIHEHLELRGGRLRGSVRRVSELPQTGAVAGPEASVPVAPTALLEDGNAIVHSDAGKSVAVSQPASAAAEQGVEVPARAPAPLAGAGHKPVAIAPPIEPTVAPGTEVRAREAAGEALASAYLGSPVSRYAVSPADHTIRQALERWARTARWTFSAEHWAVDVDIPLVGEASFETDFKSAVRELLAATEMGDRPLQPCFYSNRVLRVVSYAQACDRRGATRAVS